jgi:hypothetical protein
MTKKTDHKWNYQEQLFCIEYAFKHYKYRDWNSICQEAADHVNKNMSEDNNPTTASSIKMGYNHIVPYLSGAKEGYGSGPKGYQDAIDAVMQKYKLSNAKMIMIFE